MVGFRVKEVSTDLEPPLSGWSAASCLLVLLQSWHTPYAAVRQPSHFRLGVYIVGLTGRRRVDPLV